MKRLFDICVVLISLVLLIPIYFLITLVVKIKFGSPVFFMQSRPGLEGKVFNIYWNDGRELCWRLDWVPIRRTIHLTFRKYDWWNYRYYLYKKSTG